MTAACALAATAPAFAGTMTFETAPFGQSVGGYYQGVTFSGDVVTTVSSGYPGNGSYNITDSGAVTVGAIPEPAIVLQFATPQTSISFLYASLAGIHVEAFDSMGNALTLSPSTSNLAGSGGFGISATASSDTISAANITYVDFIDMAGTPGFEVLDDISGPGISGLPTAPDVTGTLGLLAVTGFGLLGYRRKFGPR